MDQSITRNGKLLFPSRACGWRLLGCPARNVALPSVWKGTLSRSETRFCRHSKCRAVHDHPPAKTSMSRQGKQSAALLGVFAAMALLQVSFAARQCLWVDEVFSLATATG